MIGLIVGFFEALLHSLFENRWWPLVLFLVLVTLAAVVSIAD